MTGITMTNLQDLINLAKADGGKFFVIDEKGDAKLVIMNVEDYQRLLLGKLQKQVQQQAEDIEKINREILKAQLQEPVATAAESEPPKPKVVIPKITYSQTAQPAPMHERVGRADLREEVIDPSFDFEGPKMDLEDF
jgi:hypothetical protein